MVYKLRHEKDLEIQKVYKEIEQKYIVKLEKQEEKMRLTDFKIPNFKFPKIRMKGIENIPEVKK